MREQRFLRSPQSAAAPPPAPNSNRTRIEINWGEAVAKTIEIRHHYIEAATQARSIYLKPGCLQVRDLPCGIGNSGTATADAAEVIPQGEQLALDAQAQKIFASRAGRLAP